MPGMTNCMESGGSEEQQNDAEQIQFFVQQSHTKFFYQLQQNVTVTRIKQLTKYLSYFQLKTRKSVCYANMYMNG